MTDMTNAAPVAVNNPGLPEDQRRLMTERLGVSPARLRLIYNGFEPPAPLPGKRAKVPGSPTTFIMVARGLPEKGWLPLVQAFQRLRGECC